MSCPSQRPQSIWLASTRRVTVDGIESTLAVNHLTPFLLTQLLTPLLPLHPGWPLKTNLGREQTGPGGIFDRVSKLVGSSAARGSRTSLYLAGSPQVAGATGRYFSRCRPSKSSALSHDTSIAQRLWAASTELCDLSAT